MLRYFLVVCLGFSLAYGVDFFFSLSEENSSQTRVVQVVETSSPVPTPARTGVDLFLLPDQEIKQQSIDIVDSMTVEQKAGLVLMPALEANISVEEMKKQVESLFLGGVFVLRKEFTPEDISVLQSRSSLPLLFSIDAEPSLLYKNFTDIDEIIADTSDLTTMEKSSGAGKLIGLKMKEYGLNINFAPVYDTGENTAIIGNRSFAINNNDTQKLATAFAESLKNLSLFATAKHFPGHGNVKGDSHYMLPTVQGDLKELENFQYAIDNHVPIMMMGHIAIEQNEKWNTQDLPASLSYSVTTELLKEQMGFAGLVITDAMNMGAVSDIENAEILALKAGTDIILMPKNLSQVHSDIVSEMQNTPEFSKMITEKSEKIVRMKLVLQRDMMMK